MPIRITVFRDIPGPADATRASSLQRTLGGAAADAVAWLPEGVELTPAQVDEVQAAFGQPDVAALALIPGTLSRLGCRVEESGSRPALFAPAGAAVYHRARVLAAGGIETTLTYGHEDANLGWRLALRGWRTAVSASGIDRPAAVRTLSRIDSARRLRHVVANELATLFVCAGDDWRRRALPGALARQLSLAASAAGLDPAQFDFGREIPAGLTLPVAAMARLLAIDDFIRRIRMLEVRRAALQAGRTAGDETLLPLFAADPVDDAWLASAGDGAHALCRMLGIAHAPVVAVPPPSAAVETAPESGARLPDSNRVSVIVLTALGPTHLPACLDSLAALDHPRDALEVIVVDNASIVDPTPVVERHFPGARVLRQPGNLGFCGGNNAGARAASHPWLFFLNDDTRMTPGALAAALETARRRHAACVGALTVSWEGALVDFAGGGVSFEGRGFQHGVGDSDLAAWQTERPIAFATGAAMLVSRDAYQRAGGFPDPYFAYYEDVALGWALWLQGDEVWLSPRAVVHHLHHGTSARSASAARVRHVERNALFTVLTHAGEGALPDQLGASLMLAANRIALAAGMGGYVDDGLAFASDHRLSWRERLDARTYTTNLMAALYQRGARRKLGIAGSAAAVGARGMGGAVKALIHLAWHGGPPPTVDAPPPSEQYFVEAGCAAALAAVADWCRQAGVMEPVRAARQGTRRRSETETRAILAENWLDAVPVERARAAENARAHQAVTGLFGFRAPQR